MFFSILFFSILFFIQSSSSHVFHPHVAESLLLHKDYTSVSDPRVVNRRLLSSCPDPNPYIRITATTNNNLLSDDQFIAVKITGVLLPSSSDWVAMLSPSSSRADYCPLKKLEYVQTGDVADLPLLCHYPVKSQYVRNDPGYLSCERKECVKYTIFGACAITACVGELTFHVVNIRTEIEFALLSGGFQTPCLLARSVPLTFANPNQPLRAHVASVNATAMKAVWISGSGDPQQLLYGNGSSVVSDVATFTADDMCSSTLTSPARDFGWHDPGFIHTALMTELSPSSNFSYKYGSNSSGWSHVENVRTPPAVGDEVRFISYGDMGKTPRDLSSEHYIQPGALSVINGVTGEVNAGKADVIFHIGDISYATGFLVEWDYFLDMISSVASRVPYMTAIGNHERDYMNSGSTYMTPDSGGECGVPYENYFQMPTQGKDKPWYSVDIGTVHFTVVSTEHDYCRTSEQFSWIEHDLKSVDRSKTPWLVFAGHRPMYSSSGAGVDDRFRWCVEPLLIANKVDLAMFGHVHNYERTCSIYKSLCKAVPTTGENGVSTYDHSNYTAPAHTIIGMAGFKLDGFIKQPQEWSARRIKEYGYLRGHATQHELYMEFVNAGNEQVDDRFLFKK